MITCLFGLLPAALRFTCFTHLLEERGERRVGLSGGVFSDLHRLALGRGGGLAGFADGWFSVSLRHRLADTALFVRREAWELGAAIGRLLAIAFALARGFTAGLGFWLTVTFFASASRLGVRLAVAAFGAARLLTAGLGIGLAAGLVGLTLFHGLTDLFKNRGDRRVGLTGGFIGGLAGFLLGLGGGLLGLGGLLMRFLYGRVLIGFLHGLAEALLFVRGERYRETWVGATFGGRSLGSEVRARGVFGRKAEGGEEEQG